MKLTGIEVEVWNHFSGRCIFLKRYYTNPDMEHTVWLSPDEIETYLYKYDILPPYKPGIHHLTRPL